MLLSLEQDQHGRANLKTLILYQEEGALEKTKKIENYYGFENGIGGKELYESGIKQAENMGVEIKKQEVTGIQMMPNGFAIKTEDTTFSTRSVILKGKGLVIVQYVMAFSIAIKR